MRLQIPYNEFEQLLSEYFQQKMIRQIKLAYVDESTIQVIAVVKIKLKVMNVKERTPHGPLFSKIRKHLNKKYNLGLCNCQGRNDYNEEVFAYNIYAVEYEPDKK